MKKVKMSLTWMSYVVCAISLVTVLSGCGGPVGEGAVATQQGKAKHPNLKLHRPKSLGEAVTRLSTIHDAVNGEGELPAPATFDYVEVIHGRGPSAHSHFYLAENFDSVMEHDEEGHEEEEHEEIQRHTAEVDFRSEFADVVRWLPDIAAASDLNSTDWQTVSGVTKKMNQVLASIPSDSSDPKLRDCWKEKSSEIEAMLNDLRVALAAPAGENK